MENFAKIKKLVKWASFVVVLPCAGYSATVAEYEASASLSAILVSAVYVNSGNDARAAINEGRGYDENDSLHTVDGTGQLSVSFRHSGVEASISGYATSDGNYGFSYYALYAFPAYYYQAGCRIGCSTLGPVRLTFDYSVQASANTTIFDPLTGSATASAEAWMSFSTLDGRGDLISSDKSFYEGSGTYSVDLEVGGGIGVTYVIPVLLGEANYTPPPSVVPLPASLTLLMAGIGGLGIVSRGKKKPSVIK